MQFFSKLSLFSGLALSALTTASLSNATANATAADRVAAAGSVTAVNVQMAQFQDFRPRIAVLPLVQGDTSTDHWWTQNYDDGQGAARGITELLVNELLNEGSYSLLDNTQLSDAIGDSDALAVARQHDLDAVVMGTITQFDLKDKEQCVNAPFVGRVCNSSTEATVQINVRLVDPLSDVVLAAVQGEGKASSNSFGLSSGRIPDLSSAEQRAVDEILSTASERAIEQLVPDLAAAQDNF
ncbi:MAG: CsgG/HfaB family protein [Cyanobacteria bacterium P01_A01_bin.17]